MTLSARKIRRATLAATIASLFALAACSSNTENSSSPSVSDSVTASPSAESSPSSTIIASTDLSGITVTDTDGVPTVKVAAPWGISSTQVKVLSEGGTQKLTETSTVTLNYVGVNGTTAAQFDTSYGSAPATFSLNGGVITGFSKGLIGQSVGSRVLIGIAPADGYTQGSSDGSISAGDSLIFVVDIVSADFSEVTGEEVTPADGLPTVTMSDSGPEIAIAEGASPPAELVVQPLVKGPGVKVAESSTIEVKYRVWNYADRTLITDGWVRQSGVLSNMIEGWKQGLVGQTSGSRVMLIVPPDLAYPDGDAAKNLAAGQTLVFVVDLLNVTG